jgi:carboxymethylenebutenolidase
MNESRDPDGGGHLTLESLGATIPAYFAEPPDAGPTTPSVVLAMHVWGVDAGQRAVARRFAAGGFAAIVPDLYARMGAPSGDGVTDHTVFLPFAQALEPGQVESDLLAAAGLLRARYPGGKTAIGGFCMGGMMALRRSSGHAATFSAVAVWYGSISRAGIAPHAVDIPIVASFGADDAGIPIDDIDAFHDGLRVPSDFVIYPDAGHGFFDETRAAYDEAAAEDSWRRTVERLQEWLKP